MEFFLQSKQKDVMVKKGKMLGPMKNSEGRWWSSRGEMAVL